MRRTLRKLYQRRFVLVIVLLSLSCIATVAAIQLLAADEGLTSRTRDLEESVAPATQSENVVAGLNADNGSLHRTQPSEEKTSLTKSQTSSTKPTGEKVESRTTDAQDGIEDKKVVYLTFDDGPIKVVTPELLEVLSNHGVEATFFVRGDRVEVNPQIANRIVQEGHQIANHTFSHDDLTTLENPLADLRKTGRIIEKSTGVSVRCYRPPFGSMTEPLRSELTDAGLKEWRWNFDTFDWRPDMTEDDIRKKLALIGTIDGPSGDVIVLMHDQTEDSMKSVRALDTWLEVNRNNFDFRTLPEC